MRNITNTNQNYYVSRIALIYSFSSNKGEVHRHHISQLPAFRLEAGLSPGVRCLLLFFFVLHLPLVLTSSFTHLLLKQQIQSHRSVHNNSPLSLCLTERNTMPARGGGPGGKRGGSRGGRGSKPQRGCRSVPTEEEVMARNRMGDPPDNSEQSEEEEQEDEEQQQQAELQKSKPPKSFPESDVRLTPKIILLVSPTSAAAARAANQEQLQHWRSGGRLGFSLRTSFLCRLLFDRTKRCWCVSFPLLTPFSLHSRRPTAVCLLSALPPSVSVSYHRGPPLLL